MLTNPQKALLKRAQKQAALADAEYREALGLILPGCKSSTDARLTDELLDNVLKYFEAIYWRKVDRSELTVSNDPRAVFKVRGYWATKNTKTATSRERFTEDKLQAEISELEEDLARLGFGFQYQQAIQNKIRPFTLWKYKAALERTLKAKQRKENEQIPF